VQRVFETFYIYIYIYIEREREREREKWTALDVFYFIVHRDKDDWMNSHVLTFWKIDSFYALPDNFIYIYIYIYIYIFRLKGFPALVLVQ